MGGMNMGMQMPGMQMGGMPNMGMGMGLQMPQMGQLGAQPQAQPPAQPQPEAKNPFNDLVPQMMGMNIGGAKPAALSSNPFAAAPALAAGRGTGNPFDMLG